MCVFRHFPLTHHVLNSSMTFAFFKLFPYSRLELKMWKWVGMCECGWLLMTLPIIGFMFLWLSSGFDYVLFSLSMRHELLVSFSKIECVVMSWGWRVWASMRIKMSQKCENVHLHRRHTPKKFSWFSKLKCF